MKELFMLCGYEWKKLWKKKSTWIALGILLGFLLLMDTNVLFGSTYVNGEFYETHWQQVEINKKNARALTGRKIDDTLLKEMQDAYARADLDYSDPGYMWTTEYKEIVRPYEPVYNVIMRFVNGTQDAALFEALAQEPLSDNGSAAERTTSLIYRSRDAYRHVFYDAYGFSETEREYWEEKAAQVEEPATYRYAEAWFVLLMQDFYMVGMSVIFLTAICVTGVFTEEHSRKTDQIILCTKYGRRKLYGAKLLCGGIFSVISGLLLLAVPVLTGGLIGGFDGFTAAVSLYVPQYSYPIALGTLSLIAAFLLILVSLCSGVLAMMLAELTKNGVATLAIIVGTTFVIRLIPVPATLRFLSQLWSYLPVNLLYMEGLFDMRLVSVFGVHFTIWQFAPFVYIVVILLLALLGRRVYCRYQVNGR